jgi:DNA-binding response OmpR family regulator
MTIMPPAFLEMVDTTAIFHFGATEIAMERGMTGPTQVELDSYQVALVPVRAGHDRESEIHPNTPSNRGALLLPFTWKELVKRVRTEIDTNSSAEKRVRFGESQLDLRSMEAWRSDRPVALTAMEFKVLRFFVLNPNRVISRDELLNQVWGYERYPCTRTVDNHVLRLRHKFEVEMANPIHFRTVHGVGYKFIP